MISAETPEDVSGAIPIFLGIATTEPAELDSANDDAKSNEVVLSVVTSADGNAEQKDANDWFSEDFDDDPTDDSKPVLIQPHDLDEFFTGLPTNELVLL